VVLALALLQFARLEAAATEGSLDPAFDTDGTLATAIGADNDVVRAIAVQPDGKIVAAGYVSDGVYSDFALARYNPDGSLDTSFSSDGRRTTDFGLQSDEGFAVLIQPDGKIVAAGWANIPNNNQDFALVRYNANGSLDTNFGGDGRVTTDFDGNSEIVHALAIQPDGKIVAVGESFSPVTQWDFALARYRPNGTLDPTFGGDGKVTTPIMSDSDTANAVALQPDGKIVAAGEGYTGADYEFALARYNANGSLDAGFDADGLLTTVLGVSTARARGVIVQPDGKILAAGSAQGTSPEFGFVRYSPNGTLDTSFDGDGKVTTVVGTNNHGAVAVGTQPDGRIVAGGSAVTGANFDFAVVRLYSDGVLDTTFHTDGKATTPVGANDDIANAMAIQPDGKIVVAGAAHDGSYNDFAVARFIGDSTAPYGARMIGVPRYSLALTRTLAWTASDDNTGIDSFRVRRRSASYNSSTYGSWDVVKGATAYPYGSFKGLPGRTFCYQVRGRDLAGNVGAYSPSSCVGFPVDDRTLNVHGSWANGTGSAYYRGTFRSSTDGGAYLSLPVDYRYLAVVVTKCSGCGKLKVFLGSTLLRTIDTSASSTRRKVVIAVSSSYLVRSGTLKLVQASGGKKVIVDGVAVNLG